MSKTETDQDRHDTPSRGTPFPKLDHRLGPARRISSSHANSMIEAAMRQAQAPASHSPAHVIVPTWSDRTRSARLWRACAVAAVLILCAAGGAAAAYVVVKKLGLEATPNGVSAEREKRRPATLSAKPQPVQMASTATPTPVTLTPPVLVVAPVKGQPPPLRHPAKSSVRHKPIDLLEEANRLRAIGAWQEAKDTYERVARQWPKAQAAYAAHMAIAGLHSEQGKPHKAARLYRYLLETRPSGILAEEARLGLIDAYAKLHDRAAEKRAAQEFLRVHPDSVSAKRVRARLQSL